MNKNISRRDFLKLAGAVSAGALLPQVLYKLPTNSATEHEENILIIIFDALSAHHLSLYGYSRETMPNLTRLAERGTIFHNHYSGGNFTTPGVATLLTGTYPWTHRAFNLGGETVVKGREKNNLFSVFSDFYRITYSQNSLVNILLYQFLDDIDYLKKQKDLFLRNKLSLDRLFYRDGDIAPIGWDRSIKKKNTGYAYSLFFSQLYGNFSKELIKNLEEDFPRGIPLIGEDDYFLLEDGLDWLIEELNQIPQPFLGYFHYLPPHRPYHTRKDFVNVFSDDRVGYYIDKAKHPLFNQATDGKPPDLNFQREERQWYDEFILYADSELGRLYNDLEKMGLTKNTWIIFTSDHGEMFERGIFGHNTPTLYQPIIHVPLIILQPEQQKRQDVFTSTSSVDVLPTLLKISGKEIPDWIEGEILPPYSDTDPDQNRSIYALEAKKSEKFGVLNPATVTQISGKHKLIYTFGYDEQNGTGPMFELFDLENDPEELENIYSSKQGIASEMESMLLKKIQDVNEPYRE